MYGNQASASSVLGFAAGFWWKPLSADFPSHQTEHNQVPYFGCFWSAAIIIAHSVFDFVETWVHMSPKICFALFRVVHKLLNRRWGGGGVSPNDYKITWGSRVLPNNYSIIEEYTKNIISAKKKKKRFSFSCMSSLLKFILSGPPKVFTQFMYNPSVVLILWC